jgi:hypothetical protein
MKQILIAIDDRTNRELERVAPVEKRMRAEFIRLAIWRAIDVARDRATERAYRAQPLASGLTPADLAGWDEQNALAKPVVRSKRSPATAAKRRVRRERA